MLIDLVIFVCQILIWDPTSMDNVVFARCESLRLVHAHAHMQFGVKYTSPFLFELKKLKVYARKGQHFVGISSDFSADMWIVPCHPIWVGESSLLFQCRWKAKWDVVRKSHFNHTCSLYLLYFQAHQTLFLVPHSLLTVVWPLNRRISSRVEI